MDNPLAWVLFVGVFVVVFGGRWLIGKASDKVAEKVHQTLNKDELARQDNLWECPRTWTTTSTWSEMRASVDEELAKVYEKLPGMRVIAEGENAIRFGFTFKGARIAQGEIQFGFGGTLSDSGYEFQAEFSKTDNGAFFQFVEVVTGYGVGRCIAEMEELSRIVERSILSIDPNAKEI